MAAWLWMVTAGEGRYLTDWMLDKLLSAVLNLTAESFFFSSFFSSLFCSLSLAGLVDRISNGNDGDRMNITTEGLYDYHDYFYDSRHETNMNTMRNSNFCTLLVILAAVAHLAWARLS